MPFKTILKMMVLLFPALLNAAQSLSGGSGSATLPAGAPFSNLTNIRFEIRLHNWSYNGTYQPLYESNSFYIRIFPSNTVVLTSWDDSSLACSASVVSGTDAIFRFQRDAANSRLTCEAFNTQTGASIFTGTSGFPTPQTPSDAGSNLTVGSTPDIAYIRVSSTVVAPGTVPGNTYNGDLLDYEFEGNGTDRAGHANLTLSSPAYVTTPVYAPAAVFNPWPTINTFRAGASMQLDARNSFTSTDNATLRYFWQQLSGPLTGTFSNRTSATPAFSASLAGTYGLQLTVTDSGGLSSVTTANIGAVATDSNGVVVTGLSAADNLLGPVIQAGQSPWMYWDLAEEGTATAIGTAALANPPIRGAQIAGSFSATQGSATVTGPTGALTVGEGVIIAWNAVTDGNGAGNYLDSVQSITDSTHFVLNQANNTGQGFIPPSGTGLSMYQLPVDTPTQILGLWDNGNALNWWNFYDDPVGFYRLWQRTGRTAFLTTARALADYNWAWLLDHGYNHNSPPRGSSLLGQFVRALDGHPERIPLLYSYINFYQTSFSFGHPTPGTFDNREMGYSIWWLALGAKVDTDPAHHTWYCNAMANVLTETGGILADQYANGSWGENVYSGNPGYPYPPLTTTPLVFGNSPWRQNLLIKGLEADYESLADTTAQGCNNTTVAAQVLTAIEAGVNFEYNYGRVSGNRGIFYDVNYPGDAQSAKTPYNTNGNGTPPIFTITAVSAA
ncbi:MAG: PKD domain-containing protein, partial [Terriglobia bacterium]